MQQLAGDLGLSKATVSYALRGSPMVSPATCELVRKRARELGYIPDPITSAFLQQVRSRGTQRLRSNLAMLLLDRHRHPYVRGFISGAQERAVELGYSLDTIDPRELPPGKLTRILVARGILGLLLGPVEDLEGIELQWEKFSLVSYGYSLSRPQVHRVVHNHYQAMHTVLEQCRFAGLKRVGLALSNESDERSHRLWSSAYAGLQLHLAPECRAPIYLQPAQQFTGESIAAWLRAHHPDAVIFHNYSHVPKLPGLLQGKCPIIVLDRERHDRLPGIDQQHDLCGRMSLDALSAHVLHRERGLPDNATFTLVNGLWVAPPNWQRSTNACYLKGPSPA